MFSFLTQLLATDRNREGNFDKKGSLSTKKIPNGIIYKEHGVSALQDGGRGDIERGRTRLYKG